MVLKFGYFTAMKQPPKQHVYPLKHQSILTYASIATFRRYDISRRFISPVINNPKRSDVQRYYGNTILLYTPFHDRKWEDGRIKNIHYFFRALPDNGLWRLMAEDAYGACGCSLIHRWENSRCFFGPFLKP